jgi:RNA polymerase sigma-70 factor (ECF subfamily)
MTSDPSPASKRPSASGRPGSAPEPEGQIDDREWVRRAVAGDESAFARIVERHQRGLYNLAYRMVHDRELARDLTQDIFIRVHRSLRRYDPVYPFTSWIYRVASNLCIDWIRKRKVETVSLDAPIDIGLDESLARDIPDDAPGPAAQVERSERARLLAQSLAKLPESHRMVLLLRHQRDLSYEEIALILDAPLGTVKARIHRAREAFRALLLRDHDLEDLEPW